MVRTAGERSETPGIRKSASKLRELKELENSVLFPTFHGITNLLIESWWVDNLYLRAMNPEAWNQHLNSSKYAIGASFHSSLIQLESGTAQETETTLLIYSSRRLTHLDFFCGHGRQ